MRTCRCISLVSLCIIVAAGLAVAEESLVIGLSGQRMRVTHARRGVNGATPYAHAGEVAVGRLSVKTADGKNGHYKEADLGLRTLDVATEIDGLTARTTVTHVFQNQTDELLEGVFSFALPSEAAVDRFAMTINSETDLMEGSLLDKENAKSIYSNLVYGVGIDPGVLEWVDGNLFRATIFPIPPKRTKTILVSYLETLTPQVQGTSLATVYRYPLQLRGAENATPPAAQVRLTAVVHKSAQNDGVIEATLKARTHPGANGEVMLTAALDGDMPPGEDWVIAIHGKAPTAATAAGADPSACLYRAHRPDGRSDGAFALTLIPDAPAFEQPQEMDVVFMLDTSSSRTTSSLAAAARFIQGALEALNADDRFALVMFDVTARVLPGGLQAPREGNIAKALGALKTTLPMGATDVAGAFKAAEEQFARTARANTCIVYIGDAEATYGERAAEAIRKQAERTLAALKAGMYAVLTGPEVTGGAVNVSAWHARTLNALAQLSGGPVVQLTPDVRPADAGRKLVQSLGAPVLRHARLELRGPDGAVMDTTPAIVGGVFMDRALAAFGRYAAAGKATVTLSGTLDGQSYSRSWAIELPGQELANAVVEKLWARSRIGELQAFGDPQAANQAAALAKAHNLLSRNTAFLVLESERLYGDYRIARSRDNKPSADEMRVRMLAGTAVPPAARGLDAADSAAAAQNIRIAAKSTLGTTAAGFPISIGGTMVAVSLQEARVLERPEKLMHGDTILTHRQAFERRLRLSRLIAAERALPFEPETVFPQLWLQALERPPERLQGIFANAESPNVQDAEGLGDEAVWAVVLKQLSTPPTGWRQRNSPPEPVEEQLDRLLNLGKCSQVTLSDDGKTLCVDSHLLAHQILGSLLLAKPPQHYKATGHSEVLRVIITRREAAYPLEAVAPERLSAAWNFLAQLALVERQYQLSEELAGRALEASAAYATNGRPAGVLSHMIRGLAMEMRADYPAASQAYAAMLAGSRPLPKGGHALTYSALVTTMILGENVDGAIAVLERWCAQSYTPEVAGRLGEAYLLRDRRTDAIRAFSIPVEYGQANGADFAAPEDFLKRTPKG